MKKKMSGELVTIPVFLWIGLSATGIIAGVSGTLLVARHSSMLADVLAHTLLAGVSSAVLLLLQWSASAALIGALLVALLTAYLIETLRKHTPLKEDTLYVILLTGLFAVGVALMAVLQDLPVSRKALLRSFFLGQVSALTEEDIQFLGVSAVVLLLLTGAFLRYLEIYLFEPKLLEVRVPHPAWIRRVYLFLTTWGILTVAYVSGFILALGVMAGGGFLGVRYGKNLLRALMIGILGAMFFTLAGGWISFLSGELSTGPVIVFLASGGAPLFGWGYERGYRRMRFLLLRAEENLLRRLYKRLEAHAVPWMQPLSLREFWECCVERSFWGIAGILGLVLKRQVRISWREGTLWIRMSMRGWERARYLTRIHRLLEAYLQFRAGMSVEDVHLHAEHLEHVVSPDILERLESLLGEVSVDPHARPIPPR